MRLWWNLLNNRIKMIYCKIQNNGEVDINAFRLMGATTKDGDDTKIGYFGSGIKYALASALRKNIPIKIFSGEKEIKVTTRNTKMRERTFSVICINGQPTSITTQIGKDWKDWFIFREFYCNAIDEGGQSLAVNDNPTGEKGKTTIYLGLEGEMKNVFDSLDKYFSFRREPLFNLSTGKVFNKIGDNMTIYRKGIQVWNERDSIFDYDFNRISINEARETSDFQVEWELNKLWKYHANEQMISCLTHNQDKYEFTMNWELSNDKFSNTWYEALKDKVIIPKEYGGYFADDLSNFHVILPHKLCVALHNTFGNKLKIRGLQDKKAGIVELPMSDRETAMIKKGIEFLKTSNSFSDIEQFTIRMAVLENFTLGQVEDGIIYLSKDLFQDGQRKVIEVLIEEYIHAKKSVGDRTREMQNFLIKYIVSSLEEKSGIYL